MRTTPKAATTEAIQVVEARQQRLEGTGGFLLSGRGARRPRVPGRKSMALRAKTSQRRAITGMDLSRADPPGSAQTRPGTAG